MRPTGATPLAVRPRQTYMTMRAMPVLSRTAAPMVKSDGVGVGPRHRWCAADRLSKSVEDTTGVQG